MSSAPELPRLNTYSLSITAPHRTPLMLQEADLPRIPPSPYLTALHLTLSGARAIMPTDFVAHFASQINMSALKSLSLLNLLVTPAQLGRLLRVSANLEELYISSVSPGILDTAELADCRLTAFHLTGAERAPPRLETMIRLAERVPSLQQMGVGNRVYEVYRGRGEVELVRWSRTDIPRYFQIWRG